MTYRINNLQTFVIAAFISVFCTLNSAAQEVEKHLVYLSNELNIGNYFGYSGDLNYIYNEKYSAKIGIIGNIRRSQNEPSDYRPGLVGLLSFGIIGPYETIGSVNLQVGRIYYLNSKRNTRLNAAIGIGFTNIRTVENWQSNQEADFGSNYTYDFVESNNASLIINPKIEFPLGRIFGFTVSPTAVINNNSNYYGVGLGYMIGIIRSKPVSKY